MADADPSELDQLRQENARLIGLLEAHGIAWRSGEPGPTEPAPSGEGDSEAAPAKGPSSTQEKVTLFRSLLRGRDDVYALRWQSSSGRSGYAPAGHPSSLAMPVSRKGTLEQHAGRLHRQHQRIHPWRMAAGPMLLYRQLDSAMQVVSFSEARESFKAVLDRVEADADMTLITRRHA